MLGIGTIDWFLRVASSKESMCEIDQTDGFFSRSDRNQIVTSPKWVFHKPFNPVATAEGIQTLLLAEKEASKIVTKARQCTSIPLIPTDRVQRLKDARSEAAKDIEQLKAQKNTEFAAFEGQFAGSSESSVAQTDRETVVLLKENGEMFQTNKGLVLDKLLDAMVKINPEMHRNVKMFL
jgi:V-type H+-transporting ATPase subunit G